MPLLEEKDYFAERERVSRRLAAEATDPSVRTVHLKLAAFYARRAQPEEPDAGDKPTSR